MTQDFEKDDRFSKASVTVVGMTIAGACVPGALLLLLYGVVSRFRGVTGTLFGRYKNEAKGFRRDEQS